MFQVSVFGKVAEVRRAIQHFLSGHVGTLPVTSYRGGIRATGRGHPRKTGFVTGSAGGG